MASSSAAVHFIWPTSSGAGRGESRRVQHVVEAAKVTVQRLGRLHLCLPGLLGAPGRAARRGLRPE